MKNPFKKPENFGTIPHWIDESVIKDYEKSMEMEKEIIESAEKAVHYAKKTKELRRNPTDEQRQIDQLRVFQNETYLQMSNESMIATGMHIQSLKAIVELDKIMRLSIERLPQEEAKKILSKYDELSKVINPKEITEKLEKMAKLVKWWEKALDDSKGHDIV